MKRKKSNGEFEQIAEVYDGKARVLPEEFNFDLEEPEHYVNNQLATCLEFHRP